MKRIAPKVLCAILIALVLLTARTAVARDSAAEARRRRVEEAMEVGDYPATPWKKAFVYESDQYIVTTNTSKRTAGYIGQLMDYAQKNYKEMFAYEGEVEKMRVFAYRTYEEFATIGEAIPGSAGFFRTRGNEGAIHVPYIDRWGKTYPTHVLLHEGTHQFVHQAINFKVPEKFLDRFPNQHRLPSVPLWLNEGMATNVENAYYDGRRLVVGEVNVRRLRALQRSIEDGSVLRMEALFAIRGPNEFIERDAYPPAWGLTYWFLYDKNRKAQRQKRKLLKAYIDACRSGFMEKPEKEFETLFLSGKDWNRRFFQRWQDHVYERSLQTLRDLTVKDKPFDRWEQAWRKWILDLDPHKPYGGLRDD